MNNILKSITIGLWTAPILMLAVKGAYPMSFEEVSREYGNDPKKIVEYANEVLPITYSNCVMISSYIYDIMYRNHYSGLYRLGIHDDKSKGHMIVVYRDKWNDLHYITAPYETHMEAKIIDVRCGRYIEDICDEVNPDWTSYRIYNRKHMYIELKRRR